MSWASSSSVQHFVHRSSMETKEWINCMSDLHTQEPRGACHHVTQNKAGTEPWAGGSEQGWQKERQGFVAWIFSDLI